MRPEQRCGTCKWAEPYPETLRLFCRYPLPVVLPKSVRVHRDCMFPTDGTGCPTWEAAQAAPQSPKHCNCPKENHNDVGEQGARCYVCGGTNR